MHGIINVIPLSPDELPALGLALEAGSDDYRRIRFAASTESDGQGLGIALHATDDGGWRDSSGFSEQKLNAAWTQSLSSGELTLRLAATQLDQETAGFIIRRGCVSRSGACALESESRGLSRRPERCGWRRTTGVRRGLEWRGYLRSSRMDFLQHFLLGQPVEDNGQDSAGLMLSITRADVAGGELLLGADTEIAASALLQFQDGPTAGGSPRSECDPPGRPALRL